MGVDTCQRHPVSVSYGGNARDGFIGLVPTAGSINNIVLLTNVLAHDGNDLGAIDLATYDPADGIRYFPHGIAVTESPVAGGLPPQATDSAVTDAGSQLFEQASLLMGTVSFTTMMNGGDASDSVHVAYKTVADQVPFLIADHHLDSAELFGTGPLPGSPLTTPPT